MKLFRNLINIQKHCKPFSKDRKELSINQKSALVTIHKWTLYPRNIPRLFRLAVSTYNKLSYERLNTHIAWIKVKQLIRVLPTLDFAKTFGFHVDSAEEVSLESLSGDHKDRILRAFPQMGNNEVVGIVIIEVVGHLIAGKDLNGEMKEVKAKVLLLEPFDGSLDRRRR